MIAVRTCRRPRRSSLSDSASAASAGGEISRPSIAIEVDVAFAGDPDALATEPVTLARHRQARLISSPRADPASGIDHPVPWNVATVDAQAVGKGMQGPPGRPRSPAKPRHAGNLAVGRDLSTRDA